jgi:serine/threonine-protein kinase HipA
MTAARETIEVWADWAELDGARRAGSLHAIAARGKQVFSFEYDDAWLGEHPIAIDPNVVLVRGAQFPREGRETFGAFADAAPDRWGRVLMRRREALLAREGKRTERRLAELDYLVGVFDGHRMGGLRFCRPGGPFLDDNAELAAPAWTQLRELEQASLHLESEGVENDRRYGAWLRLLIAAGRSLGGARPKASVVDPKGHLWLAKFPSANDREDIGGWESVVHALAKRAGVVVADAKRQTFGSVHHTFLARRFDRTDSGTRIHFASAMTMLDREDSESGSYLDLVDILARYGAATARDLEQLWRRVAFFVCVSNVDDHLRNHGFLLDSSGWVLAPAYDMNPSPDGDGLTLNISESDNAQDLELVKDVAKHFRVKPRQAEVILGEVLASVRTWREEAKRARIPRAAQDRMAHAFRIADAA